MGETSQYPAITADEARHLFAPFAGRQKLAIGVSGGADSLALMWLLSHWADETAARPEICVLTVDHGWRADSAAEARSVAAYAACAGFAHSVLSGTEPAPESGLEAWGRDLRLRLFGDWVRDHGADGVLLAHHGQDQAETLAMRLARGSGLRGLKAMEFKTRIGNLTIFRPLLGQSPARLKATLEALGQSWIEDPSNADPRFERVRMREAMAAKGALIGLGLSPIALASSAERLGRADAALEHYSSLCMDRAVTIHRAGFATVERVLLWAEPVEIRLRVLARLLTGVSGRLATHGAGLEAALCDLDAGVTAITLGGCRVAQDKTRLLVTREVRGIAPIDITAGATTLWDDRFEVSLIGSSASVEVRPLGEKGFAKVREIVSGLEGVPSRAGGGLPGGFRGSDLVVPPVFAPIKGSDCLMLEFCSRF